MAYNKQLLQPSLDGISKQLFADAISLCFRDGITSRALLGFSGDTILLHGSEEGGRKSVVSIRNYCDSPELLITDSAGNFLFYGRYHVKYGHARIAAMYWGIFNMVKDEILTVMRKKEVSNG